MKYRCCLDGIKSVLYAEPDFEMYLLTYPPSNQNTLTPERRALELEARLMNERVKNLTKSDVMKNLILRQMSTKSLANYLWFLNFELSYYKAELGLSLRPV